MKAAIVAGMIGLALSRGVLAQGEIAFDIQPQPVGDALNTFASQSGLQVLYLSKLGKNVIVPRVEGKLSAEQALKQLLGYSGLKYEFINDRTVTIRGADAAVSTDAQSGDAVDSVHLAQSATQESAVRPSRTDEVASDKGIEEIVVTAQKRIERLQDVPVSVTAINAQTLVSRNQVRLQDYYTRVPGLSLTIGSVVHDAPVLAIRGVTTGGVGAATGANPTVGVIVDDVPYGSTLSLGGGNLVPDIDPSDLSRVEVLRGPQGTLYGAAAMGGLLKFVTADPSVDAFSGRMQGGVSTVHNGDDVGYNLRGAVNLPLSETMAIRASAFTRHDPGYIDDPGLGVEGVNRRDSRGGRVSALWRPSETLSLKLGALLQHSDTDGSSSVHALPGLGDLQQSYLLPGLGGYTRDSEIYSAILNAKLGSAEVTAITGYALNKVTGSLDRTDAFGALAQDALGVSGAKFLEHFKTEKFSQEVRLSVPLGRRLEWLLGAFYTEENSRGVQDVEATDPGTGESAGLPYHNPNSGGYTEYALFSDLTFHLTDRFDVQVGGRESRNRQDLSQFFEGVFIPLFFGGTSEVVALSDEKSKDDSFTYLLTPRFKVNSNLMAYARFASGYRPGGPNSNASTLGVPSRYSPDTTTSYEIGAKGQLLDRVLSFDASLFYIDWKDIQLQVSDPVTTFSYFSNAGKATSRGLEFSLEAKPLTGLTIGASFTWNDAELSEDFPPGPAVGVSGDRLPFSSRSSGSVTVDQEVFLTGSMTGSIGASASYVGDRKGNFTDSVNRQTYAAYTQVDVRAGVKRHSWALDFFVNNITDKRAFLAGGLGTFPDYTFMYTQPRTIGLFLARDF